MLAPLRVAAAPPAGQVWAFADARVTVNGAADVDHLGWSMALTDINGDGKADLVTGGGARDTLPPVPGPGFVQVVFGRSDAVVLAVDAMPAGAGFKVIAAGTDDRLGHRLAPAGDVNGDGLGDFIIAAPGASPLGRTGAGMSYVIFGSESATDIDLASLSSSRGIKVAGAAASSGFSMSVAGVGDVNGDGFDDIAVGAPSESPAGRSSAGNVYVVLGRATPADVDLAAFSPSDGFRISGSAASKRTGRAIAGGDINDDGLLDVIVNSGYLSGAVVVVYGVQSPEDVDLLSLAPEDGFSIGGYGSNSFFGSALAAGDVDGDGVDDVVVGSPGWWITPGTFSVGAVYVIRGGTSNGNIANVLLGGGPRVFLYRGANDEDYAGTSVAVGDWNLDGRGDVLIGAPLAGNTAGSAWLVGGAASLSDLDLGQPNAGWRRVDGPLGGTAGFGVAVGDFTGDGSDELGVGAPGYDLGGLGVAVLFEGLASTDVTPPSGSVVINNGAIGTASTTVSVAVPATDAASVVTRVALSNDGSIWQEFDYATPISWQVGAGDGLKTVQARWRDAVGNWSGVATDSIVLDASAPMTSDLELTPWTIVMAPAGIPYVATWTGSDTGSGINKYELQYRVGNGSWTSTALLSTAAATMYLEADTPNGFRVRAMDHAGNVGPWTPEVTVTPPGVVRPYGANRYATAAAISAATFSPGVPVAYVALGTNFPDALGAAAAAGYLGGPVLLTTATSLPPETVAELTRLHPGRIVVAGGPGVISNSVVSALDPYTGGSVTRQYGANRYATAAAISAATFSPGVPVAYVALGTNFPDALGAAAAAGYLGGPVLLTTATSLPPETVAELTRLHPGRIVVAGGPGVISNSVVSALSAL